MNEREQFEKRIAATPEDEALRLIFADWLEEHDQPEEAKRQREYIPSRKWLVEFAKKHHCYGKYHDWALEESTGKDKYGKETDAKERAEEYYEQFLAFLKGHLPGGERQFWFDLPYDFKEYSNKMWHHFEVVTGLKSPQGAYRKEAPEMGCSC